MSDNVTNHSAASGVLQQHDISTGNTITANTNSNIIATENNETIKFLSPEQRISYTTMEAAGGDALQGFTPFSTGFDDTLVPDTTVASNPNKQKINKKFVVVSIVSLFLTAIISVGLYSSGALEVFARWLFPTVETEFQGPTIFLGPTYVEEVVEEVEPDPHYVENVNGYTNMIDVNGTLLSYIDSYLTSSPPSSGAGLWYGSDSTTDGTWGYFIGHNPGDFNCVLYLVEGDEIIVYDDDGNARRYFVVLTFDVARYSTWGDVKDRVTGYGESVILQTCIDSTSGYRIVVAQ